MKNHSINCAICGGNTSKRVFRVGVPANRPEILLLWKQEYVKSLCDILFGSDFQSVFHEYFEHGSYCSDCLQLLWNIDFTWKVLMEKKREIQKQSAAVLALLKRNYYNRKNKSKVAFIKDRIASLHNNHQDNNYSANEVLEMIYSAIQSKRGTEKENSCIDAADPVEKVEYVVEVKEENLESELLNEYSHFDSGGEDWLTENAADEPVLTVPAILRKRKKKPKKSGRIKRKRRATKRYEMNQGESGSDIDFEYKDSKSKDADYKPPTIAKKPKVKTELERLLHGKRKQELQQLVYELSDVSESTDNESNNEDNFESITRKARRFKMDDFKRYLNSKINEPKGSKGKPEIGLQTDIVLEDFEKPILEKLMQRNLKFFHLKRLEESELNLAQKLSRYTKTSIRRLKLPAQQQNAVFKIRHKVLDKKRKEILAQKRNEKPPRIQFPCDKENCNAKLNTEEELEAHIREIHEGEKLPFYCTTCPRKCSTYSNVKSHRQTTHKGIKRFYYHFCKICQQGYKTEDELKDHLESAHQGPNPYNCAFCTEEYLTSLHLIRHVSEAHFELTPEESEKIQKQTCKKCGKWFMKERVLQRHLLRHEKPKNVNSVNCDLCQKSFTSEGSLQAHVGFYHTYIVCEFCGKSVRKSGFGKHERRHTGELRFGCSICGKRYMTNSQVSDHERVHSGIRSYVCSVCGKAFFTKTILSGHEKTHEPGYVPRKPFRRTKPNRKKKIPKEVPVSKDESNEADEGSWEVNFEQGEPSYSHVSHVGPGNSAAIRQPQLVAHENVFTHPPGFLYPL